MSTAHVDRFRRVSLAHARARGRGQAVARASALIDELALSHGLRLADALIGATAMELHATLLTGNVKHFAAIEGLQVEVFVP